MNPLVKSRSKTLVIVLLGTNAIVLLAALVLDILARFVGAAGIAVGILLLALLPFVAVLIILDFVVLWIFLIKTAITRNVSHLKLVIGSAVVWVLMAVFVMVPVAKALSGFIGQQLDYKSSRQLISRDAAVSLVEQCKIAEFYKTGTGDRSMGDIIQLGYKDAAFNGASTTQHSTDLNNFDAILTAAKQSAARCGRVSYYCNLGNYYIGDDGFGGDCAQNAELDQSTELTPSASPQ